MVLETVAWQLNGRISVTSLVAMMNAAMVWQLNGGFFMTSLMAMVAMAWQLNGGFFVTSLMATVTMAWQLNGRISAANLEALAASLGSCIDAICQKRRQIWWGIKMECTAN